MEQTVIHGNYIQQHHNSQNIPNQCDSLRKSIFGKTKITNKGAKPIIKFDHECHNTQ